jgi:hypothetical protein
LSDVGTTGAPYVPPPTPAGPGVASGSAVNALGVAAGSTEDTVQQLYGYLSTYLNIPEVGDILRRAAVEEWPQTKLEAALSQTNWWKTSQESSRVFDAKWETDRGSVEAQIATLVSSLRADLVKQGVPIDDARLHDIAKESLRMNWSTEQTKAAMDSELQRTSLVQSRVGTDFKALAQQYGVELSDPAITQWAAHSISGIKSDELYREFLVTQAKSRFRDPTLGKFLDGGGTTSQFYDPYKQRAAARLGVNPDSIDLSDPKWFAALNGRDEKTQEIRAMTMDEWDRTMMTDPKYGYDRTNQAKQDAYSLADQIGTMFGKKG